MEIIKKLKVNGLDVTVKFHSFVHKDLTVNRAKVLIYDYLVFDDTSSGDKVDDLIKRVEECLKKYSGIDDAAVCEKIFKAVDVTSNIQSDEISGVHIEKLKLKHFGDDSVFSTEALLKRINELKEQQTARLRNLLKLTNVSSGSDFDIDFCHLKLGDLKEMSPVKSKRVTVDNWRDVYQYPTYPMLMNFLAPKPKPSMTLDIIDAILKGDVVYLELSNKERDELTVLRETIRSREAEKSKEFAKKKLVEYPLTPQECFRLFLIDQEKINEYVKKGKEYLTKDKEASDKKWATDAVSLDDKFQTITMLDKLFKDYSVVRIYEMGQFIYFVSIGQFLDTHYEKNNVYARGILNAFIENCKDRFNFEAHGIKDAASLFEFYTGTESGFWREDQHKLNRESINNMFSFFAKQNGYASTFEYGNFTIQSLLDSEKIDTVRKRTILNLFVSYVNTCKDFEANKYIKDVDGLLAYMNIKFDWSNAIAKFQEPVDTKEKIGEVSTFVKDVNLLFISFCKKWRTLN